jgi:hypothetical protein
MGCLRWTCDSLGFTEMPDKVWPRVWWVGNGLLNFPPLHAAGYHDTSSKSAIDRVISSYTPTIQVAMYARERRSKVTELKEQSILLVGMSDTPDQVKLPFVEEELKLIQHLIPPTINSVVPGTPTRQIILAEIDSHQIVHLSCHGHPEPDPSQSTLLLEDWKTSPLTVADLTSLKLQKPQFAFLPAWVSRDVYAWMLDGKDKFDIGRSAEGLHLAVRRLKDKTRTLPGHKRLAPHDPIVWAPYIHVGV